MAEFLWLKLGATDRSHGLECFLLDGTTIGYCAGFQGTDYCMVADVFALGYLGLWVTMMQVTTLCSM